MNMKRKSSRRSSILKCPRPLEEVQNTSSDERYPRSKRVSFANTVKIKDFQVDQPAHASADDAVPRDENELPQASDDADTVIQISTPRGKKRRRISSDIGSKLQRLSVIPKLERSFCLTEDEFEVYEDSSKTEEEEKDVGAMSQELQPGEVQNKSVNKSLSMDLTLQHGDHPSSFSLLSPHLLLNGGSSPCVKETSLCVEDSLDFTCTGYGQIQAPAHSVKSKQSCDAPLCSPVPTQISERNSTIGNESKMQLGFTIDDDAQPVTKTISGAEDLDITCTADTSDLSIAPMKESIQESSAPCSKQDFDSIHVDSLHLQTEHLTTLGDQLSLTCIDTDHLNPPPQQTFPEQSRHHNSSQTDNADGIFTLELTCTSQANDTMPDLDPSSDDSIVNLTYPIPLHEATFVRVPAEDKPKFPEIDPEKCGDWLQNTSDNFLVDDPSLLSSDSVCDTFNKSMLAKESQISDFTVEAVPVNTLPTHRIPRELSNIADNLVPTIVHVGDIINKMKQISDMDGLDTTLITTPETTQIEKPIVKQCISIPTAESSDLKGSPENKSIIPSPSAYSKFCAFLDCDQTVLDTTCFPFPERVSDSASHKKVPSTLLLSQYLQQLHARLVEIEQSIHHRLSESSYVDSHKAITPALNILHGASIQALCAVQLLKAYGDVSDTCTSVPTPAHFAEFLSLPILSESDLNGPLSSKVQWLSEMHTCLSDKVYPAIEEVMGMAQKIYHWTLSNWSKESVCLTLAKNYQVSFQLSPLQDWAVTAPLIKILSVHIQSSASDDNCEPSSWKAPLIQCIHTADIPKAVYDAQKIILPS